MAAIHAERADAIEIPALGHGHTIGNYRAAQGPNPPIDRPQNGRSGGGTTLLRFFLGPGIGASAWLLT
jgi:hypothetical protein